jgi:hypothetical protein
MSKKNISDEAARARKLLAKNAAWKFSSHNVRKMELLNARDPQIGENAVVCVIGPYGAFQYTISHPIGLTDFDETDWVINKTEDIPSTLARSEDPDKAKIDKARAKYRNEKLIAAGLLVSQTTGTGNTVLYYPNLDNTPRNAYLSTANAEKKAELARIRKELDSLGKGKRLQKQELNTEKQNASDVLSFMPDNARAAEIAIRSFLNDPQFVEKVETKFPYLHRTLTGPFGDRKQSAITGATGLPIADVVGAVNKALLSLSIKPAQPENKPVERGRQPERGNPPSRSVSASAGTSRTRR